MEVFAQSHLRMKHDILFSHNNFDHMHLGYDSGSFTDVGLPRTISNVRCYNLASDNLECALLQPQLNLKSEFSWL